MRSTVWVAIDRLSIVLLVAAVIMVVAQDSSTADEVSSTAGRNYTSSTGFFSTVRNYTKNQIAPLPVPNVTTAYCGLAKEDALAAYENTTICLVVGGVAKILFYPTTEEFSLMQIFVPLGENTTGTFDNEQIWFQAEFSNGVSPIKHRFPQVGADSDAKGFIVPYWTLIITLKDGLVDKMEWDDGCYGCSGDACVDDTCSVNIDDVGCRSATSTADCNPKFFVGWYGTDRDGVYLTSSGARSSRFRQYSVNSAFNAAYQSADVTFAQPATRYKFSADCSSDPTQCET